MLMEIKDRHNPSVPQNLELKEKAERFVAKLRKTREENPQKTSDLVHPDFSVIY